MFVFTHFLIKQKNIFVDAEKRKRAVKSTLLPHISKTNIAASRSASNASDNSE